MKPKLENSVLARTPFHPPTSDELLLLIVYFQLSAVSFEVKVFVS
jgi:hypothetical protein